MLLHGFPMHTMRECGAGSGQGPHLHGKRHSWGCLPQRLQLTDPCDTHVRANCGSLTRIHQAPRVKAAQVELVPALEAMVGLGVGTNQSGTVATITGTANTNTAIGIVITAAGGLELSLEGRVPARVCRVASPQWRCSTCFPEILLPTTTISYSGSTRWLRSQQLVRRRWRACQLSQLKNSWEAAAQFASRSSRRKMTSLPCLANTISIVVASRGGWQNAGEHVPSAAAKRCHREEHAAFSRWNHPRRLLARVTSLPWGCPDGLVEQSEPMWCPCSQARAVASN